ncbi:hypothetical protein BDZ90DRAFT_86543 [Jaminaea rosea]|uniref:N-acetyltransferase domain-containing protein n=1 Tax=Jaminaea rosea TaxID=1569628 RepID=A0A316UIV6_9BASI|nr:hypothetical protein BDZ90DRAFT_86543 [Jaminaea rosea]PWN24854.1 hypothetical protein BDZ90DRAFT_86543 [Jaminaea rosea]
MADAIIEIKTSSDVSKDAALNGELVELINRAFAATKSRFPEEWDLSKPRLLVDDPITLALGDDALVALVRDAAGGSLVAAVAAAPMPNGPRCPEPTSSKGPWFEIKLASADPSRQRTGLVSRALFTLEEHLFVAVRGPINMSLQTCIALTGDYWPKRGFKTIHTEEAATGTWHSLRPFTIMTLAKSLKAATQSN